MQEELNDRSIFEKEVLMGNYYTIKQIASVFDVDRRTIYRWFDMGALQFYSVHERRTVITHSQYDNFIKKKLGKI